MTACAFVTVAAFMYSNVGTSCMGMSRLPKYDCFEKCFRDKSCMSYFYQNSTTMCCLKQTRLTEGQLVFQDGVDYFWLYPNDCHPDTGFTLSRYADFCYRIFNTDISWTDAQTDCKILGGSLVKLNTLRKIQHIRSTILHHPEYDASKYSIGGIMVSPDQWKWTDGTTFNKTNWEDGYPSSDLTKNRVMIETSSDFQWRDKKPSDKGGFICELPFMSLDPYV